MRLPLVAAGCLAALTVSSSLARAWQIESFATTNCHERITTSAVASAGFPDDAVPPPPTETEARAISDVPFSFPFDEQRNGWGLALLIGVRFNDVENRDPVDLPRLASIHNDPDKQDEHCLRHAPDDGPAGDMAALMRCKAFILAELELALGPTDTIDLAATEEVEVFLKFRQNTKLQLNRMNFHVGRALHALEDGYTHILRDGATDDVRHVLNWIEGNLSGADYDEARDGHPHIGAVDDCSKADDLTRDRENRSTAAATALVEAIADPAGGRAGRLSRAATVIDESFVITPGCTIENNYCDAPELTVTACGCGAGEAGAQASLVPGLMVGAMFLRRRRRKAKRKRAGLVTAFALLGLAAPALAQSSPTTPEPSPIDPATGKPVLTPVDMAPNADGTEQANTSDKVEERTLEREDKVIEALPDPTTKKWGFAAAASASFQRGAAAGSVGLRWNPCDCFGLGLDVEWNPYVAYSELDVTAGTVQVYIPGIWKMRKFGSWELRMTFGLGASMLMFDLVEADQGSIGLYANWNPLGVAFSFGPNFKLVVKPGDIAIPIPELVGFPFYYPQYRFTVGLEWYP